MAHLWAAGIDWETDIPSVTQANREEQAVIRTQLEKRVNAPNTSSMGRLFDAAASLAGVLHSVTYEAQAAIWLEALADPDEMGVYTFDIRSGDSGSLQIDPAPGLPRHVV